MLITVAHHLLTDAQPDPKQYSAAPGHLTPIYTLGMAFYGMELPSWISSPAYAPCQFLVHLLTGRTWEKS